MTATHRESLIEATKMLMRQHGYEAMSPRMILNESGAGQGSLYHHFSGKQDLASVALAEISREMKADFDRICSSERGPLERIEAYLDLEKNGLDCCPLGRLSSEAVIHEETIREPVREYFDHVQRGLARALKEARRKGLIAKSAKPKVAAATLVAIIQGGFVLSRVHRDPGAMERVLKGARQFIDGLKN